MSDVQQKIDAMVKEQKVLIFMKGTKLMPMCGFSARAVQVLGSYGVPFETVNVLADPEIRQGIKEYSNWPTIPQVYVGGEFLGGSDIVWEMHENGELGPALDKATAG